MKESNANAVLSAFSEQTTNPVPAQPLNQALADSQEASSGEKPYSIPNAVRFGHGINSLQKSFSGAVLESRRILDAARQDAEGIVKSAEDDAEQLKQSVYATAQQDYESILARAMLDAESFRKDVLKSARDEILALVLAISREVIAKELVTQPESIAQRIERALNFTRNARDIFLRINPADLPFVDGRIQNSPSVLTIVPDNSVLQGNAVLSSPLGEVASNLESHLQNIEQAITGGNRSY